MTNHIVQSLVVSIGVPQSLDINEAEQSTVAQALTVAPSTGYIMVAINPAQRLPTD